MGSPTIPKAPPALPPPASVLDTSILAARDRARSKRRARFGRRSTIMTGSTGAKLPTPTTKPMLTPQAV